MGSALVCGDHQVGVVTIPANQTLRRNHFSIHHVVSQDQKSLDEQLVQLIRLLSTLGSIGRWFSQDETTLGTDRYDQYILDHLSSL